MDVRVLVCGISTIRKISISVDVHSVRRTEKQYNTMTNVKITQLKHCKMIDFKESDLTEGICCLMGFLMDGDRHVLCKNLDLNDEEVLKVLDEYIDKCYYERYPKSLLSPTLDIYDPGNDVYAVRLIRKLRIK